MSLHERMTSHVTRVAASGFIAVVALLAAARPAVAQDTPAATPVVRPDSALLVDRIVAIVGDTAVLLSELRLEMFRIQAQGARVPPEGSAEWLSVARQLLAAAADRLILLQHAKRSGITAGDTEVESYTDRLFRERRRQFASDEEMQQAVESSGMNMLQYRQQLRNEARADILLQRYRGSLESSGVLPAVAVTEDEVRAMFERDFANQQRPATISFNQIIVMPVPGEEAQDSAIARARTAYEEIEAGDDFEIVARRHSDDPGTRDQGGELGWMRRTALVRRFAAAAWSAPAGVVVGPIQTRFGLHLIKIETIRRDERFLRHILIRPEIVEADLEEARQLAASLADSLRAGADIERLKRNPAVVDEETRFDDVLVEDVGERFGPDYARALQSARAGNIVGPFRMSGGLNPEFAVLEILDARSQGVFDLEEVADILRSRIRTQKQLDRYITDLREQTYIEVRL